MPVEAAGSRSARPTEQQVIAAEKRAQLRLPADDASDVARRRQVRKKDFTGEETIRGRRINVLEGLELHEQLLNEGEQAAMVDQINGWVAQGKAGQLRGRTFSAPRKWMPGKGRITVQFGCCYNYATDSQGRPKGIIAEEVVEPLPPVLQALCKRLVRWGILPASREPDTAIVNIYDTGDCIPPHIDHHDFVRPFVTVSLLSEQNIFFSERIISVDAGHFRAKFSVSLPTGSVLVLKGNGADVAQHCVPPVSAPRMSITLRRMAHDHAARVAAEARAALEALPQGRQQQAVQSLPSGPRKWLTSDDADSDRGGIDADRWTSRPVDENSGWGNVKLKTAKPRRK